jgi:hypothetical protein
MVKSKDMITKTLLDREVKKVFLCLPARNNFAYSTKRY